MCDDRHGAHARASAGASTGSSSGIVVGNVGLARDVRLPRGLGMRVLLLADLGDPASRSAREERDHQRAGTHQHPGDDVAGMVLAAVDPRGRDDEREQGPEGPDEDPHPNVLEVRRDEQRESAVDRDRRGHVPRRVAVRQVERVHLLDGRAGATHEVGHDRVTEHLRQRCLEHEAGHPPAPPRNEEDSDHPDERDQDVAVREMRGDVRHVVPERRSLALDPDRQPLVGGDDGVDREQDLGDEEPDRDHDRRHDDHARVRNEPRHEEGREEAHPDGQMLGPAAFARFEPVARRASRAGRRTHAQEALPRS